VHRELSKISLRSFTTILDDQCQHIIFSMNANATFLLPQESSVALHINKNRIDEGRKQHIMHTQRLWCTITRFIRSTTTEYAA
jgi:hypothetical protein